MYYLNSFELQAKKNLDKFASILNTKPDVLEDLIQTSLESPNSKADVTASAANNEENSKDDNAPVQNVESHKVADSPSLLSGEFNNLPDSSASELGKGAMTEDSTEPIITSEVRVVGNNIRDAFQ